ncbi:MAG: OPT/YSL family transporter [Bacillota bacterium]
MSQEPRQHPRLFEPATLVTSALMAALSAVICMQIIGRIGITPNTSIIGALMAIIIGRVMLKSFRSLDRQNLVQTAASGGGFAAANAGLLSVAIVFAMGRTDLVLPMLAGAAIGVILDVWLGYKMFDTPLFPAANPWPPGIATARVLEAGDEGGHKAWRLVQGITVGAIGAYFKLPMAGIGIAFIANIFAISALGVGLLIRGYSPQWFGLDLGKTYYPQGFMIGAGIVQLVQAVLMLLNRGKTVAEEGDAAAAGAVKLQLGGVDQRKEYAKHWLHFTLGAVALALISGVWAQLGVAQLALWVIWAGFSAFISSIIVGMCAMHSGWFPAFAVTVIFLLGGMALGFPAVPLAFLTGYTASTGPIFADLGYDLKTGWLIRGKGKDVSYELQGRKQQFYAEVLGAAVGILVVLAFFQMHFDQNIIPPISKVFASTIKAGANPNVALHIMYAFLPGAILQFIGGPSRALGVLFATGLLINNPIYGIGLLGAVIVRLATGTKWMEVREAGLIAGDGLYGFVNSIIRTFFS